METNKNQLMITVTKSKIPKEHGYALKTKQLEDIWVANNMNIPIRLYYSFSKKSVDKKSILSVIHRLPFSIIPYRHFFISSGSLPKKDVFLAREHLSQIVLPQFIAWAKDISSFSANDVRFLKQQRFSAVFHNDEIELEYENH